MTIAPGAGGDRGDILVEDVASELITARTGKPVRIAPAVSNQAVRWFDFHLWCARWLDAVDDFPLAGTAAWLSLDDDDARKKAAVLFAASSHVLRMETAQVAVCEVSRAISSGEDWTRVAQRVRSREEFESERPWLIRRAAS